jgi:hypothetical protein
MAHRDRSPRRSRRITLQGWWEEQRNSSILELDADAPVRFFSTLPRELTTLLYLTSLTLVNNGLHSLGSVLGKLIQLRTLLIRDNPVSALPPTINKLTNLLELDLSFLRLRRLPEELFHLRQLEILKIRECHIPEIPGAIGKLVRLRHLRFNGTDIHALPEELFSLSKLDVLEISYNPNLRSLSPRLAELPKLRWLAFKCCRSLQSLPCELWKAPSLKFVNGGNNPQLKKMIRHGGLGADYNGQKYTFHANWAGERAYEHLRTAWKDIYQWREKWPPIIVYLRLGLECDNRILEAVWVTRPPVPSYGFGTFD